MQTPTNSPPQQRKRQSPISSKARKSWNNFRSLIGNRGPGQDQPYGKPEFVVISADVSPPKRTVSSISHVAQNSIILTAYPDTPSTIDDDEDIEVAVQEPELDLESSSPKVQEKLGEPFQEREKSPSEATIDGSDTQSQFSFDRKQSVHYYKTVEPRNPTPQERANSWCSAESGSMDFSLASCDSFISLYQSDETHATSYEESNFELDGWEEESGLADLVAEANQLLSDEDYTEDLLRRRSTRTSMHRQLSQITRDDLVVTFFDETRPKRTRSTISTSSAVWPIQE